MESKVTVHDPDTGAFVEIPESELAPGMIQVRIEGRDGVVWMDHSKIRRGRRRHARFGDGYRDVISDIQRTFADVLHRSYEDWEDLFRRDCDPVREMALWTVMAKLFRRHAEGQSAEIRREVLTLLLVCSVADSEQVPRVFERRLLSEEVVAEIIRECSGSEAR